MFFKSDSSDSVNEFLWKDKSHKPRKGATGEDLSDIYKDYSLPSGKQLSAVRDSHFTIHFKICWNGNFLGFSQKNFRVVFFYHFTINIFET